ncbi:MAG: hypothetical protein KDA57_17215 [Planctomycetales bacterium]|nr:hypothetical protein [Planctomycetales bacterium]
MNGATRLLRQIHPSWFQNGRLASLAFTPSKKDEGLLSVYDGDRIEPEPAWQHFTGVLLLTSIGVFAVTGAECESLELPYRPDPEWFAEHAVVDFTGLSNSKVKDKAQKLREFAVGRDWLYRAPVEA